MFRIFILTVIVLAMTLPTAAQRRNACTVAEDPYGTHPSGIPTVAMALYYFMPDGDGVVTNYLLPTVGRFGWDTNLMYTSVVFSVDLESVTVSEPERPIQDLMSFVREVWTNEIRPELCNLERMELLPARSSVLGGN